MKRFRDSDGDVWEEQEDGSFTCFFVDGTAAKEKNFADLEYCWGPLTLITDVKMFRVVQTVAAFKYPKGKVWGPYIAKEDAERRVKTLESVGGSGLVDEGDFGPACAAVRPAYENGTEEV
jgi:hypothetical protein